MCRLLADDAAMGHFAMTEVIVLASCLQIPTALSARVVHQPEHLFLGRFRITTGLSVAEQGGQGPGA